MPFSNDFSSNLICIEMQHSLFHLFSLYGDILEINVKRNLKMKGQAFIVFSNVENATKALHDMQGYNFFDKRIVGWSVSHPHIYRKSNMPTALQTQHSRQRENLINSLLNKRHLQRKTEEAKEREAKRKEMQEQLQEVRGDIDHIQQQLEQKKEEEKRILIDSQKTTLTVENLPQDTSEELLEQIFQKYQGLKSVFVNQAK